MKVGTILYEDYQTKDGREIELKREEDTERENRGFTVDEIRAYVDGEEAGYLKIQYIPHNRFHEFYPTVYNFLDQIKGHVVLPHDKDDLHYKELSADERRKMLQKVVFRFKLVPYGTEKEYVEKFSDREVMKDLQRIEHDMMTGHEGKQFREFKNYHKDKPFVDYIRVYDEFKRQRIAEAMYLEAAKWMKERGMKFYASGLQSDDAKGAWDHLSKKHDVRRSKSRKRRYLEPQAA